MNSLLAGCWKPPTLDQPGRLYSEAQEIDLVKQNSQQEMKIYQKTTDARERKRVRDEIITQRMFAIDLHYTVYEARLTHEAQEVSFGAHAVELGLTTAGALIPIEHTTRLLSGLATGVNGLDTAYEQKIMFTRAIQNVQTQMRASRNEQAAKIYGNMACSAKAYTLGMALADLENYYRAGTFTSGLISLANTVNNAETDAKAQKDAASPGTTMSSNIAASTKDMQNKVEKLLASAKRRKCPLT